MNEKLSDIKILGENLLFIQNRENLSCKSFSRKIKYDRLSLSKLQSGLQDINLKTLIHISKELNISLTLLLSRNLKECCQEEYINRDYLEIFICNVKNILESETILISKISEDSRENISRILSNKIKNPRISSLSVIAKGVGVSLSRLFTDERSI